MKRLIFCLLALALFVWGACASAPKIKTIGVVKQEVVADTLHEAAKQGDTERVKELLKEGHGVNAKDGDSWTPLHYAEQNGHTETAQLLRRHGGSF